jgi:ABC-type multidrug transport system fused ATPase/permease subunit
LFKKGFGNSIISLLLRFYDVDGGTIYLNGNDIRNLNINWLRSQIGYVSKETILFNSSIYENICLGDVSRTIPMNEVVEACRQASISNRIETLPNV